jgi:hypothetical protein
MLSIELQTSRRRLRVSCASPQKNSRRAIQKTVACSTEMACTALGIHSGHMLGTGVSNRRRDWWPKKNEKRRKQNVNGDPRVGDTLYLDLQPTGLRTSSRFQRLLGKDICRQFCLSPGYKAGLRMVHEVTLQRATDRRCYMSAHLESCQPRFSSFAPPCTPISATFYLSLHILLLVLRQATCIWWIL